MAKIDVKSNIYKITNDDWLKHFKKTKLKFYSTEDMSHDQWLEVRNSFNALGGSDIGTLFGLNPWLSAVELFYRKCGFYKPSNTDSEAAFHGRNLEPYIRNLWRCESLDGSIEDTMRNYNRVEKTRDAYDIQGIVVNPKYPDLIANTDGGIFQHPEKGGLGILECKQISHRVSEMWENGIPPAYIFQIHLYALVFSVGFAELASLKDGMFFQVHEIPIDKDIQKMILERAKDFMSRVREGIEAIESLEDESEQLYVLTQLEPEYGDDPKLLERFYSEMHKEKMYEFTLKEPKQIAFDLAKKYADISKQIKASEKQKSEVKAMIMQYMNSEGANVAELGDHGRITWRKQLRINWKE